MSVKQSLPSKKKNMSSRIVFLFAFIYFISYVTRINYSTIVQEMVTATGLEKSVLSVPLTGCAITYGIGQLISGYLGDKVRPKRLITLGLCVTVCMNILIPFCATPSQMTVVWCINGFAQAFMWPPIVKLMTALLSPEEYVKGSVKVSWGSSLGTMLMYLSAPFIIMIGSWKSVFFVSAAAGIIGIIIWNNFCPDADICATVEETPKSSVSSDKAATSKNKFVFPVILVFIMLAIALQGILRDGVQTWMPSYLSDTFNLGNKIAILSGVVLPIFSIVCYEAASVLYRRVFKNPMFCAAVIFGVAAVSSLLLWFFSQANPGLSVFLSALLTGCMHGVNVMLICIVPSFFAYTGRVSVISGILNACTYIGSAVSNWLFPYVSENYGWTATVLMWVIVASLGMIICAVTAPTWKKKYQIKNQA